MTRGIPFCRKNDIKTTLQLNIIQLLDEKPCLTQRQLTKIIAHSDDFSKKEVRLIHRRVYEALSYLRDVNIIKRELNNDDIYEFYLDDVFCFSTLEHLNLGGM